MTEWLSGIYFLIKSSPQIFAALIELKKMWDDYLLHEQKQEAMQLLGEALNAARTERDTTKLAALVNNIISSRPLK